MAIHLENWSGIITKWRPWGEIRRLRRPQQRWYDDIKRTAGLNWFQMAQKNETWENMREVYAEKIENG